MAAPKRSQIQIEHDRVEIARLYLQGVIQADIAARLGMTRQMVGYDLKAIRGQWLESSLVDFSERVAVELAKIDNLEIEYWDAWQRSKQVKESSSAKVIRRPIVIKSSDKDGNSSDHIETLESNEMSSSQEQMIGNKAFLDGVQWCIDRRLRLFGLDKPLKIDWRQTLPDGLDGEEVQQQFMGLLAIAAAQEQGDADAA